MLHDLAADLSNRSGQGDFFGTDFYAVLSVAAFLDTAVSHERGEALALQCGSGGMSVEQTDLRDGGGANESGVFVELRTGFHATAAGDAVREWIRLLLGLHGDARTGAEVVGAIDGHPGFHFFEVFKKDAAIDG